MLSKLLNEIDEADLQSLGHTATPEGLTLEFKRELNLGQNDQKREVAKDVSALANTAGGRLLYGIEEVRQADGSLVAGPIAPLTDGTIPSRLSDVLHSVYVWGKTIGKVEIRFL
jgi:predicted HTH transcriptional regulator